MPLMHNKRTNEQPQHHKELLDEYFDVKTELSRARNYFENVTDPDLIAASVFEINAAQQRYRHVLGKLRAENICNFNRYR